MSVLLQRARDSGKFPPSLLSDAIVGDGFEEAMLKVMDLNGKQRYLLRQVKFPGDSNKALAFTLSPDPMVAGSFASLLQVS